MNAAAQRPSDARTAGSGASLVAVRLPADATWLRTVDEIWQAGDAVLPLAADAPDAVVAQTLRDLRPTALIDASGTAWLDNPVGVERGTSAVIATSGSTGTPKGAVLSWNALDTSARGTLQHIGATSDDRWLC